jgi:hypothetical protein
VLLAVSPILASLLEYGMRRRRRKKRGGWRQMEKCKLLFHLLFPPVVCEK